MGCHRDAAGGLCLPVGLAETFDAISHCPDRNARRIRSCKGELANRLLLVAELADEAGWARRLRAALRGNNKDEIQNLSLARSKRSYRGRRLIPKNNQSTRIL